MSTYGHKIRACKIPNHSMHSANAHMTNERNQPPAQNTNYCNIHNATAINSLHNISTTAIYNAPAITNTQFALTSYSQLSVVRQ